MVKINEVEWDKARKTNAQGSNNLTDIEEKLLGRAVRIEIPLTHPSILPEIAEMLRKLADTIDNALESEEGTLRSRLFQVKYETYMIKGTIRDRRAALENSDQREGQ